MKKYLLLLFAQISVFGIAQEDQKFGIEFHGYVKTDIFFDSRQTVDAREGHFLLYPTNESLDFEGNDINARPKFNILSIQTRLTGKITGPDALGAKTSGLIEGAFFGNISPNINVFRLRHAIVKLTWENAELMVGQYWHPMFITSSYPETVSFNTGAPFQPFTRNPQIRFTKKFGMISVTGTALEQVDFVDNGPSGLSPRYLINTGIPELNLYTELKTDNLLFGIGGDYKTLLPRLYVGPAEEDIIHQPEKIKSDDEVAGFSSFAYLRLNTESVSIKLYGVFGQLTSSMTMLGGYAEKDIITEPGSDTNYVSRLQRITYTPYSIYSTWMDIQTHGEKWQLGLFAGFTKNLGASDSISASGKFYGNGKDIGYMYRIAPRAIYTNGKLKITPEIEYTVAAYATKNEDINEKGVVTNSKEIANFRLLLGVYYTF